MVDLQLNYQYRAFGVPGLGLQRGLSDDVVIAPYASMLALLVDPRAACANLRRMADAEYLGPYGFYDGFSLHHRWCKPWYLAIDQGPIVVMMENHRTGLLWRLFMSCPEVQTGLDRLGFRR
jgi:hypothetical protein